MDRLFNVLLDSMYILSCFRIEVSKDTVNNMFYGIVLENNMYLLSIDN